MMINNTPMNNQINDTPVSYGSQTIREPELLADVNIADMMRATLDVLMITRENANITYKALFGDTRPDPEMSHFNGGSMIEMMDDIHSIARDILQMVVSTKNGLGIEESPVLSSYSLIHSSSTCKGFSQWSTFATLIRCSNSAFPIVLTT